MPELPALPEGTVTFFFTDLEGSTRLWEQHPQGMPAAQARHDALLRAAVAAHHGQVVKMTGDGLHAVFKAGGEAVAAALAAQRALQAEEWGAVGPLRVRMGLHTGEAEQRAGDYYASAVNRAARLMAAGHGGQILLSAATYELVRDALPASTDLKDLGQHRLKDLIHPEHLYQLAAPDLPSAFPPLKTLENRPHNLPVQQTSFLGRERELADVVALLRRPEVHLLTLTGPGGTGKTRLALQVAAELLDKMADGAFFVDLAPLSEAGLVVSTVAVTLGLRESGGLPLEEIVTGYLQHKELLLVLDNFEHVVEAASRVAALLAAAPRVKVAVTSRVLLRLYGEQEYPVPPLALPPRDPLPALPMLTQNEAVDLFIQRARLAQPAFAVTNENAPAVAEICVRLDGLPLAIELAAARVKLLPPPALLSRLERRLAVLTGGARDLPARQQTLRGTIDWSYALLNPGERTLFAWLAVFAGGCTLEAAEDVCAQAGGLALDVLDGLSSLVDKSLLRQEEEPESGEPRFIMLATLHEYAQERLAQSGTEEAVRRAHTAYYVRLAETADEELRGPRQSTWFKRLTPELDNFRAALAWTQGDVGSAALGLRLAAAMWWFWWGRGLLSEQRAWLDAVLAGGRAVEPDRARAQALVALGFIAWLQGDGAAGEAALEESRTLAQQLGDPLTLALALTFLGLHAVSRGDIARGQDVLLRSAALAREAGAPWILAWSLHFQGDGAFLTGDLDTACTLYAEELALRRTQGDTLGMGYALHRLGDMAYLQGDYRRATQLTEESLALYRMLDHKIGMANDLLVLGQVARRQQADERAEALLRESLSLFRELAPGGEAEPLVGFAGLWAARGELERAARLLGALFAHLGARGGVILGPDYPREIEHVRAALGEAAFAAAWAAGQALTLAQASALALEEATAGGPGAGAGRAQDA
jgi:predicted ATPase/class 3 adenylate cyclase